MRYMGIIKVPAAGTFFVPINSLALWVRVVPKEGFPNKFWVRRVVSTIYSNKDPLMIYRY
jgi:hypothetical protein